VPFALKTSDTNAKPRMKLHPKVSKSIREFFLSQGIIKGVVYLTTGSILISVLITIIITSLFGSSMGLLGLSLAIFVPAVIASIASYVTLSLYFDLEQSRQEIRSLAITDDLTQIFNRRYFFELAGRELERTRRNGRSLAIILFDVDNFKLINDSLGHMAGDLVLQEMCKACQSVVRPYDVFARFGGEEFIVLLPDCDEPRARTFAERLRQLICDQGVRYNDVSMQITVSVGVAVFDPNRDKLDDLISRADNALYKAKNFGKNRLEIG
jgi:diguanylate cyclase (GGDEF)-like protein